MNADPIARLYRTLEYLAFGQALERCRFSLLDSLSASRRILILGEGDGRFLARLLATNARAAVSVLDSSAQMLQLARTRVQTVDERRVTFLQADALAGLPGGTYDAIVTNFFLDCLTGDEAQRFVPAAASRLEPGGQWLIGEFHLPDHGPARWHAHLWLTVMYCFFAMATGLKARTIPPYEPLLKRAGLTRQTQRFWRWRLLTAEVFRKDL